MKKFFKEFGAFISRGNIIDMAIGVVIGTAFNKIVSSLVNDIIMPLVGSLIGSNVSEAQYILVNATQSKPAVILYYGRFIQTIIDFLIIAFSVFVVLRIIMKIRKKIDAIKKKEEAQNIEENISEVVEPVVDPKIELLTEIRDLLSKQKE